MFDNLISVITKLINRKTITTPQPSEIKAGNWRKNATENVEVMWLMKKLAPDFKTIADFRKNNVGRIKGVFKEFVYLCRNLDLYGAQLVAIDGTKFKAVNSRSNNLNEKTVALRLKKTEEKIAEYLKEMDQNDTADSDEDESIRIDGLNEKIS